MSDPKQKICDVCHERPARHHVCYGDTEKTRALCLSCFEQTAPQSVLEYIRQSTELVRRGKCTYCGAPVVGSFTGTGIFFGEKADLWCEACRLDLVEFNGRPENEFSDYSFDDEAAQALALQQLADYEHRKAEFMRQKISQRS